MNDALDYRTCLPAWRKDQEDMIFVLPYLEENQIRYKQINILWGTGTIR